MDVLQVFERVIAARAARHGRGDGRGHGVFGAVFGGAQCGERAEAEMVVEGEGLQLKLLRAGEAGGSRGAGGNNGAGQAAAQSGTKHLGLKVWLLAVVVFVIGCCGGKKEKG